MMKFVSHSEAETEAIGEKFARMLHPGDVVAFTGGLGAGKNRFYPRNGAYPRAGRRSLQSDIRTGQ